MAVYTKGGTEINEVFSVNGTSLSEAYDVYGYQVLEETPVEPDLVVMTYNYQWCDNINSQLAMQQAIISKYEPNIIGLQEAGTRQPGGFASTFPAVATQFLSDYPYKVVSATATNPNGIASKIEYEDYEEVLLDSDGDDQYWDYQKCYITVKGKRIAWFNTHLTYKSDAVTKARKYRQATELFNDAETEDYVIITGDFNMYGIGFDNAEYIGIGKQFADAGYNLSNWNNKVGFVKTWTSSATATSLDNFSQSCDNIITSPNIRIKRVVFDTTKFDYLNGRSIDHIPVIAYLVIN